MHLITDACIHPLGTSRHPTRDEVQLCSRGSMTGCTAVPDSAEGFKFIPAEFSQLILEYFHTVGEAT